MPTFLLAAILFALAIGIGTHIARYFTIYLVIGAATALPAIVLSNYYSSSGSPAWTSFTDLLGEAQAINAQLHVDAILAGLVVGVVVHRRSVAHSRRDRLSSGYGANKLFKHIDYSLQILD